VQGLGETLPVVADRFDLVTMGYALRHVPELEAAFREFFRVLRPGGRLLLLEITRPPHGGLAAWLLRVLLGTVAPRLGRLGTGSNDAERMLRYYWSTIVECVPPATIVRALETAGFAPVTERRYGRVLAEYDAVRPTA
jgi:demethylmenaquinone methyltransferase/2-methoxy-6-polyprenyl-1,4-benzoquinol methylase